MFATYLNSFEKEQNLSVTVFMFLFHIQKFHESTTMSRCSPQYAHCPLIKYRLLLNQSLKHHPAQNLGKWQISNNSLLVCTSCNSYNQIVKNGHLRNKKIVSSSVCRHLLTSQYHIDSPTLAPLPTVRNVMQLATHFLAMQQQKYHLHQISCHWAFRKQAVSSPVLKPLKSDAELIVQHGKLQEPYRDQKHQVFFSIEIILFQN